MTVRFPEDPRLRAWTRLWAKILVACWTAMVGVVTGSLWALNGFHGLGTSTTALAAVLLGTVGAMALAVALMGLVFYSDESEIDESVRDASTGEAPASRTAPGTVKAAQESSRITPS